MNSMQCNLTTVLDCECAMSRSEGCKIHEYISSCWFCCCWSAADVVVKLKLPFSFSKPMVYCPVNWQRETERDRLMTSGKGIEQLSLVQTRRWRPSTAAPWPNPHCNCRRHRHRHRHRQHRNSPSSYSSSSSSADCAHHALLFKWLLCCSLLHPKKIITKQSIVLGKARPV